jgi:hypothetical protein
LGTGTVFFSRIFLPSGPLARACSGSVTGHRCEHVICCGPGATGSRNSALANPHSEWEAIGRLWRFTASGSWRSVEGVPSSHGFVPFSADRFILPAGRASDRSRQRGVQE